MSGFIHSALFFQGSSYCGMYQYFICFYGWIIHSVAIPHFIYVSVDEHLDYVHLLVIVNSYAMNIFVQVFA